MKVYIIIQSYDYEDSDIHSIYKNYDDAVSKVMELVGDGDFYTKVKNLWIKDPFSIAIEEWEVK